MGYSDRTHQEADTSANICRGDKSCHVDVWGEEYFSKRDIQCKGPGGGSMPGMLGKEWEGQSACSGTKQGSTGEKSGRKGGQNIWDLSFCHE